MASAVGKAGKQVSFGKRVFKAFMDWYVYACGYRQLGLRTDDLLMDDHPDVVEAIKRLPQEEYNLRNFRLKRAYDLTMKQIILPKEHWTTPEEDKPYLRPYIEKTKAERLERQLWDHQ